MNIEIFKLFGSIFVDNDEANKSISKTDKKADGLGKRLGRGIKTAAKWAVGLTAAAAAVGAGMFAATKKVTDGFDKIAKTSTKLGVSTDAYQEMEYWAGQNGIATQQLERGLGRLNQRMGLAANGNEKYSDALTALGVDMDGVRDGTVSTEDAFATSIKTLSEMTNEQEKSALASELFGTKLARDLMPALQDGSLSLEDAKKKAQELGIVIDEDTLSAAEQFNDTWDDLTRMMGAFGQKIIAKLIPVFQRLMDWVIDHMPQIQAVFSTAFDVIGNVMSTFGSFLKEQVIDRLIELYEWIEPHFPMIKEFFMDAFGVAKEIIEGLVEAIQLATEWIQEHWAIVEPILIGIAAGVIAFETITTAIAAYGAITKGITAIQLLFNAALTANPIGIVVVAIGLLVAAGVALYKNWDTVKEKAISIWNSVTEFFVKTFQKIIDLFKKTLDWIDKKTNGKFKLVTDTIRNYMQMASDNLKAIWDFIKNTFKNALAFAKALVTGDFKGMKKAIDNQMANIKNTLSVIWSNIKNFLGKTVGNIVGNVKKKFNEMKGNVSAIAGGIKSVVSTKFNNVKNAIMTPINKAKDLVKDAIDKIKGFFSGMKLKFPKINMPKLPKFSLDGKFSLKPPSVPKLKVNWNALGGVFTEPTIFNTPNAGLQGVGEAGSEAILPLNKRTLSGIGNGIANTLNFNQSTDMLQLLSKQNEILIKILNKELKVDLDSEEITNKVNEINAIDATLGGYMD